MAENAAASERERGSFRSVSANTIQLLARIHLEWLPKNRTTFVSAHAFSRATLSRFRGSSPIGATCCRLATQLVKSGASVGANLEESVSGQTKPDFIAKQCIALKESREARFWLRLIATSEPSLASRAQPLVAEASDFVAMLTASVKTSRANPNRGTNARSVLLLLSLMFSSCL